MACAFRSRALDGGTPRRARRSAAHDLPCEESRIIVTHPTETQITADGCGQRAVYTVNSEGSSYRVEAAGTTIMERLLLLVNRSPWQRLRAELVHVHVRRDEYGNQCRRIACPRRGPSRPPA
jgi:hypothetical protein